MTSIQDVLVDLKSSAELSGCLVLTPDGITVASELSNALNEDLVAGLASFLVSTTKRVLQEGEMGDFSTIALHSTHGKVLLVTLDRAYLVVLTNQFKKLETCMSEIQEAATQIRRLSRISV